MKKIMMIIMISSIIVTGCTKKESLNNDKTTESTTTTTTEVITEPTTTTSTESTTTKNLTTPTTKKITIKGSTTKKTTKKPTTTTKKKEANLPASQETPTTTKSTTTTKKLTEEEVYNAMIALKNKYPDGTPWTNDNKYIWKASNRKHYTGCGCAGFAFLLTDAAFGTAPATKHTDFKNIRVGDIIRQYGDSHSVVVLKVNANGYTVAEGNMNGAVYWGREVSKEEAETMSTYIYTRW